MVFDHDHDHVDINWYNVDMLNVCNCQVGVISDRCKLSGWVQPVLWDAHSLWDCKFHHHLEMLRNIEKNIEKYGEIWRNIKTCGEILMLICWNIHREKYWEMFTVRLFYHHVDMSKYWFDIIILWLAYISTFQSIDNVYWTEDAADEDMMNTYCWMYGHLNLPHDYMVVTMMMMFFLVMTIISTASGALVVGGVRDRWIPSHPSIHPIRR